MKLFNIDKYLLLISKQDEILNNDLAVGSDNKVILCTENNRISIQEHWSKILAYYPLLGDAKELDLPLLPNPFEAYNKEMALRAYPIDQFEDDFDYRFRLGFEAGFKDKFTLEDMEAAVCFGMSLEKFKDDKYKLSDNEEFKGFIKSLQIDKLPKEFIVEYDYYPIDLNGNVIATNKPYPFKDINIPFNIKEVTKIVLNSEGKKQICGTYKW